MEILTLTRCFFHSDRWLSALAMEFLQSFTKPLRYDFPFTVSLVSFMLHNTSAYCVHYNDVIMGVIASQITSLTIIYSTVYSDADQRKHQSSASLAFVRGIHWWLVNSPHKGPVTQKMFPFDDVIVVGTVCTYAVYVCIDLECFLWMQLVSYHITTQLLAIKWCWSINGVTSSLH